MFGKLLRTVMVVGFSVALAAWAKDDEGKSLRPDKQPKVDEKQVEGFRKSNPEIAELYDEVQAQIDELVAVQGQLDQAEAGDKRKIERRAQTLRGQIIRERRKLDRALERKIKEAEEAYLKHTGKVDENTAKAKQAEAQGNDRRAQQYYQEAAKYSGPQGGAKRNLDLLYYHCFFEGEEILKSGEAAENEKMDDKKEEKKK
ncbi:MAG: hypothetical protein RBU25_17480 [Lentisphaeria bacterium]|jgi:type IV secretory pathway VirB10-like protein|nr:hypothetical protein [Lentisphaeria bacterium]